MLMFREEKSPDDEIKAWQFWHGRQHSVKQRILDAGKLLVQIFTKKLISENIHVVFWFVELSLLMSIFELKPITYLGLETCALKTHHLFFGAPKYRILCARTSLLLLSQWVFYICVYYVPTMVTCMRPYDRHNPLMKWHTLTTSWC